MNPGSIVGTYLGVKFINGKIKPKYSSKNIIGVAIIGLLILASLIGFVLGIIYLNIEVILFSLVGILAFGYLFLISPYTQKSKNYYMEFKDENTLKDFKLYYKGKLVNILYEIDKEGKIMFANNNNKLSCLSYGDNSKMSNFTKYKIINYFSKWLNDNNLMSKEITVTFEKL